jgi:hypothetical protein
LKPEWWGSPLAQEEKYQGRKPVTRNDDDDDDIIIIISVYLRAVDIIHFFAKKTDPMFRNKDPA